MGFWVAGGVVPYQKDFKRQFLWCQVLADLKDKASKGPIPKRVPLVQAFVSSTPKTDGAVVVPPRLTPSYPLFLLRPRSGSLQMRSSADVELSHLEPGTRAPRPALLECQGLCHRDGRQRLAQCPAENKQFE